MDLNILIGQTSLFVALLSSLLGSISPIILWRKHKKTSRSFSAITVLALLISSLAMEHAFLTHDFNLAYVYQNNTTYTNLVYDLSGMWSALSGSLLLWAFLSACWGAVFIFFSFSKVNFTTLNIATTTLQLNVFYFCVILLFRTNPFTHTSGPTPTQGLGANPLLQNNFLVAIHPVLLYLGLTGLVIPYAITLGNIVAKDLTANIELKRAYLLLSTSLLGLGILLGALWSYQVLGWGGYWSWDPVENAALLPWVIAIGSIHGIRQYKVKKVLPNFTHILIISAFSATIFTTFVTRSGILESLHAFSESSIGPILLIALVASFLVPLILMFRSVSTNQNHTLSIGPNKSFILLVNNLIVIGFSLTIVIGTLYSLVPTGMSSSIIVGPSYFNQIGFPLACITILMLGLNELFDWTSFSADKFIRKSFWPALVALIITLIVRLTISSSSRLLIITWLTSFSLTIIMLKILKTLLKPGSFKYTHDITRLFKDGTVAHLGVLILSVGVAFSLALVSKTSLKLYPNQPKYFEGHSITFTGFSINESHMKTKYMASLRVDHSRYDPSITVFSNSTDGIGSPSIDSRLIGDIYLTLESIPSKNHPFIYVGVIIEPAVFWIWVGGFVIFLGTLLSIIRLKKREASKSSTIKIKIEELTRV